MRRDMSDAGLIVIGSGPAGVGAAEAFRACRPDDSVRILTADYRPPYQRPPLSKEFLRGQTDEVAMEISEPFETVLSTPVQHIDVQNRVVTAGGVQYGYRALIFAAGASPATPT